LRSESQVCRTQTNLMSTCRLVSFLLLVLLAAAHQHRVPIIDLKGADTLIGTVREDQRVVSVVPELTLLANTGPVCSYEIGGSSDAAPLTVEITDKESGAAIVRVRDGVRLDCAVPEYQLTITAVRCDDGAKSESVALKIIVKDTNDHAPEFDQPWYTVEVDEGRLYAEMLHLTAVDRDCGHPYGEICRYEISNAIDVDLPFAISDTGILRNTKPLNYTSAHSHILSIVAHDCGMRKSKSTLVTVNVRRACVAGLQNVDRVDYYPNSGGKYLFPDASMNVCANDRDCDVRSVKAIVQLHADHIGGGCDRDTHPSVETRERCGINSQTVDILPRPELANDESKESDSASAEERDESYFFDGTDNAVIVSPETVRSLVPTTFTLSFSMRHAMPAQAEQNEKHTVICESDDHQMNRHHFAVYVHHCKLAMLLRHENEPESEAKFRPAEWRWQLPHTCDDRWHHYAILFTSLDKVELYVDGKAWQSTEANSEILDDWPLHKTKDNSTRLVVGACWHGRVQKMAQFFRGHLAEMLYLPGLIEKADALQCLHSCKEQLQFTGLEQIVNGESIVFNHEQSTLTLTASKPEDLSHLLQKVTYMNTRDMPTIGHRPFDVAISLQCAEGNNAPLPTMKGFIFVRKAATPTLRISGATIVHSDQHMVKNGAPMLPDVKIVVTQPGQDGIDVDTSAKQKLDWCKIHLRPSRDMELEYFSSPAALIASLHLDFEHDKQGLMLKGGERVKAYREVLSKIHYFNTHPDGYTKRLYVVQCAMMHGKVLSNEFNVTMSIEKNEPSTTTAAAASTSASAAAGGAEEKAKANTDGGLMLDELHEAPPAADEYSNSDRLQSILEMDLPRPKALVSHHAAASGAFDVGGQSAIAGGAVAVIVVVCVGFLLVLLVIGVLRLRETPLPRRRRARKTTSNAAETGMEWDDSGMNITINPLDDVEAKNDDVERLNSDDYDESSDGGDSYRDDDMSEDDDEEEVDQVLPHVAASNQPGTTGLEWDDSTLTNNVSRTYRV
jgi:hypothetical protein